MSETACCIFIRKVNERRNTWMKNIKALYFEEPVMLDTILYAENANRTGLMKPLSDER